MTRVTSWLRWDEIEKDPALGIYGAALAFVHATTYFFWSSIRVNPDRILDTVNPQCWPFLPHCDSIRALLTPWLVRAAMFSYLPLAIAVILLFLLRFGAARRAQSATRAALWGLLALTLLKGSIQLLSYELMGNYHYMHYFALMAFLFIPGRRRVIPYLLVGFYVAAGSLKLNYEWLSGSALLRPLPWGGTRLLELSCAWVVILELVVTPLLLLRAGIWRWIAYSQILIFHAISWYFVGPWYPIFMVMLTSLFPLSWLIPAPSPAEVPVPSPIPGRVLLAGFALMQVSQWLPGVDPALRGTIRLAALNMYDARSECASAVYLREGKDWIEEIRSSTEKLSIRIACDPIIDLNEARNLCRERAGDPEFQDLSLVLSSRRYSSLHYEPILSIRSFCAKSAHAGYTQWLLGKF